LFFGLTAAAPNITAWFDGHDKRMIVILAHWDLFNYLNGLAQSRHLSYK
jgi:hypothetical protein